MNKIRNLISVLLGLAVLTGLVMGLTWLLGPQGVRPAQQVSPLPTPTPGPMETPKSEEIVLITPPFVPSPPPTPTPRPWPVGTPFPTPSLADDPSGTILYTTISDSETVPHRQCTVHALQVDKTGQPLGEPRKIASIENCGEMKVSPDGRYLAIPQACGDAGGHPIMLDITTLQTWPLFGSDCAAFGQFYGWHPDSKHILFAVDGFSPDFQFVDGQSWRDAGLWLVDVETNEYSVLAGDVFPNGGAAVGPDGTRVVYVDGGETWMISLDGSQRERLDAPVGYLFGWSPDGNWILYAADGGVGATNVLDGRHVQLDRQERSSTSLPTTMLASWSPDGRTVAATQVMIPKGAGADFNPFEAGNIYLLDASGSHKRPLLSEGTGLSPAWSPDGSMLVFLSDRSGATEMWVVGADGTNLHQLTYEGPTRRFVPYYAPIWIPSGR